MGVFLKVLNITTACLTGNNSSDCLPIKLEIKIFKYIQLNNQKYLILTRTHKSNITHKIMNKTLIFLSCLALGLLSTLPVKSQTQDPKEIEAGKLLISKSDCFACHKPDVKLVGPAYIDVAKKYKPTEANITLLAGKIIKGGSGTWGQIPMLAHPKVTQADAKKMVKFILSHNTAKK